MTAADSLAACRDSNCVLVSAGDPITDKKKEGKRKRAHS